MSVACRRAATTRPASGKGVIGVLGVQALLLAGVVEIFSSGFFLISTYSCFQGFKGFSIQTNSTVDGKLCIELNSDAEGSEFSKDFSTGESCDDRFLQLKDSSFRGSFGGRGALFRFFISVSFIEIELKKSRDTFEGEFSVIKNKDNIIKTKPNITYFDILALLALSNLGGA
jgi:hypothetical protein